MTENDRRELRATIDTIAFYPIEEVAQIMSEEWEYFALFARVVVEKALDQKAKPDLPIVVDSGAPLSKTEVRLLREMIVDRINQRGGLG